MHKLPHKWVRIARVKIRRGDGFDVRPEAEKLDGKVFIFRYGFTFNSDERYAGEQAWMPTDRDYPEGAPWWIASGDLEDAEMGEEFNRRYIEA